MSEPHGPRVPTPAALSSTAGVSAVIGLALGALGCWMLHLGTRDASLVRWECAVSTCGTDDFAGAAPVLGLLILLIAGTTLTRALRTVAFPLVILAGAVSALLGWRRAVDQRLITAESVRVWLVVAGSVAAVALVVTLAATIRELRRSSGYWVLFGRSAAWGRVTDFQNAGPDGPTGTVHFADAEGNRYSVRTRVPQDAFRRPPRVYYDPVSPTDPGRLRIGMPGQPLTAAGRRAQVAAVRTLLPLPGDEHGAADSTSMDIGPDGTRTTTSVGVDGGSRITTVAPDGTRTVTTVDADGTRSVRTERTTSVRRSTETITDVSVALERLSDLHRTGALSDDEFAAAKAAVLRR